MDDADTALNGKDAIEKILSKKCKTCKMSYSLILMDLSMPIMNGFETAMALRSLIFDNTIRKMNIVATTAQSIDNPLEKKCLNSGFDDVISKPFRKKILTDVLKLYYADNLK